jgi:glycosyltransferase involved in cell wall biosynthesis
VLAQGCSGWSVQVVVVDDGSSDDLLGVLRPYGDRVICIRHPNNCGPARARNTGITATKADYIAFLDSDDIWLPSKLGTQLAAMRANNWAASCTAYYLTRGGVKETVSPRYPTGSLGVEDFVWGCFVSPGSTLVCARSIFEEIGPLDTELQRLEDWDWLLRYGRRHELGFLAQPLARIQPSNHRDVAKVLAATDRMRAKHMQGMPRRQRRHFAAALDLERAAAHYHRGDLLSSVPALARSFCRSPVGHMALAAVLHNWLARG